jgi:LCP family protein required for cell wall assembly
MTLYEAEGPPPKSRLHRTGRVFGWMLLVLVVLAVGFGGGVYLWLHEAVAGLNPTDAPTKEATTHLVKPVPGHAVIALVLGYDHRVGQGNAPSRSDSMMLLRLDPKTHTISMLSLPRDLAVTVHCPARLGIAPYTDRINAAYSRCGPTGSLLTVSAVTGLRVNYLITVNFRGFKKVVNTLGGVWVDVDRRYYNADTGPYGYAAINLQPGYQRLTGGAALDFVRFRHTDSDIYRVARQQLFVQAMKEQLKQNFDLGKALAIIQAASDNVEVGIGGGKHVDLNLVYSYGKFIYDLPGGHFFQPKIGGLAGASELTTSQSDINDAVHQFTHPSIAEVNDANTVALGGHVAQTVPKPSRTTILVLNGNGVAGSAGDANARLAQRGYRMLGNRPGQTGNAPTFDYFHTKVYYQAWMKQAKAAAHSLAAVMAPADAAPLPRSLVRFCGGGTMLCVVVGKTYHNSITPPPVQHPIVHQRPTVVYDRAVSEPYVRDAQRRVPFPLMVPVAIESSSSPDTVSPDVPVRVYDITGKQKAVRLVYRRSGVNEYWGVEETTWQDAPVLGERSFHREIGGRGYDLYYHGPHLHMVVLHVGQTGYWVINTLVDSLSNETMLAIAKGLQPLNAGPSQEGAKK